MLEAFGGTPWGPLGGPLEGPREGFAGSVDDLGGLSSFLQLLQLSYSELGPPCFAGGAPTGQRR